MKDNYAIILAAGQGTRMKSKTPKVLHQIAGKAMVEHIVDCLSDLGFKEIITIVGADTGAEAVQEVLGNRVLYAKQTEQLGTAHAVLTAKALLADKTGNTLVIAGDTPLILPETFRKLLEEHESSDAVMTILTAHADDPNGYGRIVRDSDGRVLRNVEHKDANADELAIQEVNTGVYLFDNQALFKAAAQVGNDNAQGEYYLPDVLGIFRQAGETIAAYQMPAIDEAMGINNRAALACANQRYYQRIAAYWQAEGVSILDPASTYIDADVTIGRDTIIYPNVRLRGKTTVGEDCVIESFTTIRDSQIADKVYIRSSEIEESQVGKGSDIGPHAHLRPKSQIGEEVHIGNYVEIKNATLGKGTKVGHLAYVGDADLGERINVSCGVIFCNYDGKTKSRSTIGDDSFIGSNVNIISPVNVAAEAFIAAGSTINQDVPRHAMAIARERQVNKSDYWHRLPISQRND